MPAHGDPITTSWSVTRGSPAVTGSAGIRVQCPMAVRGIGAGRRGRATPCPDGGGQPAMEG